MKVLLVSEGKHELQGALETLVRRLSPHVHDVDHDLVSRRDIHTHRGIGQGFFKRAMRWTLEARKRGYEALILVVDEDGQSTRARELAMAQEYVHVAVRRALGVAIRTFDAWMLADEQALTSVLGCVVQRQPAPEDIDVPKQVCRELLAASAKSISQAEMYSHLAGTLDLAIVEVRCPKGFGAFAARVRRI
jgi:hypothetical protein